MIKVDKIIEVKPFYIVCLFNNGEIKKLVVDDVLKKEENNRYAKKIVDAGFFSTVKIGEFGQLYWENAAEMKDEKGNSYVTNPLSWTTGNEYASQKLNQGSVLRNFNKVYKQTTDAQISNGLLYVKKPQFPWSFLYFTKNYHIADINLYYLNIRENIRQRIGTFWKK